MYQTFNVIATVIISIICILLFVLEILNRLSVVSAEKTNNLSGVSNEKKNKNSNVSSEKANKLSNLSSEKTNKLFKWSNGTATTKFVDLLEKFWFIPAIAVAAVFLFSRFKSIDLLPYGVHIDELGMLHEAKDLALYGTDRYGHSWPVYLQNYGGGMGPMYAYLTSVVLRVFPMTIKCIRSIGAVVSCVALVAMFGLGVDLTGKRIGGVISATLFTAFPTIMMMNRWDSDCHLLTSLTAMSLFLIIHALKTDKVIWYVMASFSFGVGLYTYLIACLVYPMFLVLVVIYMFITKHLSVKKFCALFFPVVVVGLPLFVAQIVNMGLLPEFSFLGSDFFVFAADRVGETTLSNIPHNIGVILGELIHGDTLPYNAFEEFGAIYTFCIPLIFYGLFLSILELIDSIRKKKISLVAVALLFAFSGYFMALTHSWPNLNRYQEMFIAFIILMLVAIYNIGKYSEEIKYAVVLMYVIGFVFFSQFYFTKQMDKYADQFLFTKPNVYDAVFFVTNFVDPSHEVKVYASFPYDDMYLADTIVETVGMISTQDWLAYHNGETENIGRFYMSLPEELDVNENAIYIMGRDWDHISNYLISIGFNCDESVPDMRILWR